MAIKIDQKLFGAYYNRGIALEDLHKLEEAVESYDMALKINPDLDFLSGSLFFAKNILCDWQHYEKNIKIIKDNIFKNKKISTPFSILSIYDSPELQNISAEIWIKEKFSGKKL